MYVPIVCTEINVFVFVSLLCKHVYMFIKLFVCMVVCLYGCMVVCLFVCMVFVCLFVFPHLQ